MVRISDIVKVGQAAERPAQPTTSPRAVPPPSPVSVRPAIPAAIAPPRPLDFASPLSTSRQLYEQLVAECQQRFEQVQHEQRLTLGQLPGLIQQAVQNLSAEDAELGWLSLSADGGFSLAHHGVHVALLAISLGLERDMKPLELVDLGLAAALHDVGMVPIAHLAHSQSQLDEQQRHHLREHPLMSYRLFQHCPNLPPLALEVALQEHERCDGSGYPNRLTGSRISQPAQLVGVLDVYESLTHDRPHRKRLVPSEAMRTLLHDHGAGFYTDVLRSFFRVVPIYPVGTWVRMNTGELAKVVSVTRQAMLSPTVSVLIDPHGQRVAHPTTLDLSTHALCSIVSAVAEPSLS